MLEFSVRGKTGLPAICSEVNHSGEMKGATAPTMLLLIQLGYLSDMGCFGDLQRDWLDDGHDEPRKRGEYRSHPLAVPLRHSQTETEFGIC